MKQPTLHKLITGLDINEYHQRTAGYSSSQFKDLLDDEDVFIGKYIEKRIEREESTAFDVGTYFHTGVLEPHLLKKDCVVFQGKIRRGKDWERFKEKNKTRTIVTESQKTQASGLIDSVKKSKVAQKYLGGKPEISLYIEIVVHDGQIYAPHFGMLLTREGWIKHVKGAHAAKKSGFAFTVKVRADMLGKRYISDLKSTSSSARSARDMQKTVSDYEYDLSAALYMDMFALIRPEIEKFIWIFASKQTLVSKTWRASGLTIRIGRAKYMKAFLALARLAKNNWKIEDTIGVLEPAFWERKWLDDGQGNEDEIDLL